LISGADITPFESPVQFAAMLFAAAKNADAALQISRMASFIPPK
jgi:hypothetical protein